MGHSGRVSGVLFDFSARECSTLKQWSSFSLESGVSVQTAKVGSRLILGAEKVTVNLLGLI